MAFDHAGAYDRFMGRFSRPLAQQFLAFCELPDGDPRVLDVGCGPGELVRTLAEQHPVDRLAAADPSAPFVATARERVPGLDVRTAPAEALPWPDATFDAALAQLVVHFMTDPVAGLREMGRVVRPGGTVAACVWDTLTGPVAAFWAAVADRGGDGGEDARRAGTREGHLVELAEAAGLSDVRPGRLEVTVHHPSFADWWEPFELGVGPAGDHVASLGPAERTALRDDLHERLGDVVDLTVGAWAVRAVSPASASR